MDYYKKFLEKIDETNDLKTIQLTDIKLKDYIRFEAIIYNLQNNRNLFENDLMSAGRLTTSFFKIEGQFIEMYTKETKEDMLEKIKGFLENKKLFETEELKNLFGKNVFAEKDKIKQVLEPKSFLLTNKKNEKLYKEFKKTLIAAVNFEMGFIKRNEALEEYAEFNIFLYKSIIDETEEVLEKEEIEFLVKRICDFFKYKKPNQQELNEIKEFSRMHNVLSNEINCLNDLYDNRKSNFLERYDTLVDCLRKKEILLSKDHIEKINELEEIYYQQVVEKIDNIMNSKENWGVIPYGLEMDDDIEVEIDDIRMKMIKVKEFKEKREQYKI